MVLNRKRPFARKSALILILAFLSASLFAAKVPELQGHVNDYANLMNKGDRSSLENYLTQVEKQSGIQIAVLTVPTIGGEDLASYSMKVCETWKLGQKDKDNGCLLLVAYNEHQVRIETGYGLEGDLTDTKCGLIIRNVIIPRFKSGNYSKGIVEGAMNIGGVVCGDLDSVDETVKHEIDESSNLAGMIFMLIWVIFFFAVVSSKGGILKWIFLSNMMGGRHGHYHHHNSGPTIHVGGHNSFGGGGFGGFSGGGGHFGGGGASGRW